MYNNIALLLGHLVGDYLFQSKRMALEKSKPGIDGTKMCSIHCFIYSLVMVVFVVFLGGWRCQNLYFSSAVCYTIAFLTHYPFDRISFGWMWMRWIKQSQFTDDSNDKRNLFVPSIYIAVDNTIHLVLMWILFSFCGR